MVAAGQALPAYAESEAAQAEIVVEASLPATADIIPTAEAAPAVVEATPAESTLPEAETAASFLVEDVSLESFQVSDTNLLAFDQAGIESALVDSDAQVAPDLSEGVELAQARGYSGVSPAYLGVGGNFGFGDPDSAIGDFGFNVISKISLGPRFSLRPGFFISERFTNFAIPLTYNFNLLRAGGFRFQPYVGAGVDVPFNGNTALMVNAGADVPISRDFTLNTAANFRVTSGFGFGLSVGVGYNFPFIFE
ncbi:MAG: hypothetical protein HC929_08225 [Leptolyngbyaceae cyanobacterium SM2_5_2]|nr:hypothetical protein [Leptolyngbyaceae cyanobacterium SM2_5_2]